MNKTAEVNTTETKDEAIKSFKLIKRIAEKGNGEVFPTFKYVNEKGKLIDAHFRRDVNLNDFADGSKFIVEAEYVQMANGYEYPRVYIGSITKIEKIY